MSAHDYEDYEKACKNYDEFRLAAGGETELNALRRLGKPLRDLHIADVGCGTGNYTKYFLDNGVGKVSMFDASEGMLRYARTKVADYVAAGRVPHCEQLELPCPIPGGEQRYDAICINFVLHHLGSPDDDLATETFPKAMAAIRNVYDALRKGGLFILLSSLRPQLPHIMWHTSFITDLDDLFNQPIIKFVCGDYNIIERALTKIGFSNMQATVPLHEILLKPHHYYNIDNASDPRFIQSVSTFALIKNRDKNKGTNHMETYFQRLRDSKERNELAAVIEEKETLRKIYGCITAISAEKP
ncbi:PREDICTED: uncharacterized protein LOC106810576 [Priapulus caudatus]|uniref:Uncharacterized protein LOC106810576 n=1 Tax=Priapulus caudatus TaxID=37621 RepID=A0ABM1EB84_PRICU|nr:PREDICTED: uncharacterized protein LOC106810576 [Priapulus caudatus]